MNEVKVSVIVLTYNSENFISETISSVFSQNYENLEIIVGDDASTDRTLEILGKIREDSEIDIKIAISKENSGISKNFNQCLSLCSGKYIFLLGHDDIFLDGKISSQVEFMEKNNEVNISYHDASVFNSESGAHLYFYNADRHGFHSGDYIKLIKQGTFNCGSTVAVRNIGLPFCDENIKYASDWLWYIEILKECGGQINFFPGVYAKYRRHQSNITKLSSLERQLDEVIYTLKKYSDEDTKLSKVCRHALAERRFAFGLKFFISGNFKKSFELFSIKDVLFTGGSIFIRKNLKLSVRFR